MHLDKIVLTETEPETEWLLGGPVRKVSPKRRHGSPQVKIASALDRWAAGRGQVASEWRFRVAPPGEPRRPLVPDASYVPNEMLRGLSMDEAEAPAFAPAVAVETLSKDDRAVYLADKVDVLLRCGTELVIVLDPYALTVDLIDRCGRRTLRGDDALEHEALPDFRLQLPELFAVVDLPR